MALFANTQNTNEVPRGNWAETIIELQSERSPWGTVRK